MCAAETTEFGHRSPPFLSSGALKLLSIALQKDRDKRITRNAALRAAYDLLATLPAKCQKGPGAAWRMLGLHTSPASLFRFCAELLRLVEQQLDHPQSSGKTDGRRLRWERSEYDHPVLLALAQTVAHAAGMTRSLGPDVPAGLRKIAETSPALLRRHLVENYFGNILQDYFDACEVRFNVPDLPEDTELQLRESDGRAMADWIFEGLATDPSEPVAGPSFDNVQRRVSELMTAAFLADGQRSQARRARHDAAGVDVERRRHRRRRGDPGSRSGGGEVT
jgi:hypothetical protein